MTDRTEQAPGWPRPGYPLLPALYREAWSEEHLPEAVLARAGLPSRTTAGDLDGSVWEEAERPEALQALANYVNMLVKARLYFRDSPQLADQPILGGTWNAAIDPRRLPFSERTRNVLGRAGRLEDERWLAAVSAFEFFSLRGAGTVTLLDFATVGEAHAVTESPKESEADLIQQGFERLREEYPIATISTSDPRLRGLGLGDLRFRGLSVSDALTPKTHDGSREASPIRSGEPLAQIAAVRSALRELEAEKLDGALLRLLREAVPEKYVVPLAKRLGWDGKGGSTLQEAADLVEVSRERIRQREKELRTTLRAVTYVPSLDRAIDALDRAAETFDPDAASLLRKEEITSGRFLPAGVVSAAKVLGRSCRFEVGKDKASVQFPGDTRTKVFKQALVGLGNVNHVASVLELQARIHAVEAEEPPLGTVKGFLERRSEVVWLDDDHNWFWVRQAEGRNRILLYIRKILAVADSLPLETLRDGVLRHHRTRSTVLPRNVLAGLCRAAGFHVRDGVVSTPKRTGTMSVEGTLGVNEKTIVKVLQAHGGVMHGAALEKECLDRGLKRSSFWVYLTYSPVLERLAPSVYAVRGAKVDPAEVAHFAGKEVPSEPALRDDGWTEDGAIWLGYIVNRNTLASGVVSVPARVRSMIGERRLELFSADGATVGTFVVSRTGQAWGLTPFLNRRGPEEGDALVIGLDTDLGVAVVQAGSVDLLLNYQDGGGWGPRRLLEKATQSFEKELLDE